MKIDPGPNEITFTVKYLAANAIGSFIKTASGICATDKGSKRDDIHFSIGFTSTGSVNEKQDTHLKILDSSAPSNHKKVTIPTISKASIDSNYEILGILFIVLLILIIFIQ